MRKIRAIIKRPDEEYGHVTWISDSLENLQRIVGGYIETVTLPDGTVIICNEEGRFEGLPYNCTINRISFVGDIAVVGTKEDEFADLEMDFDTWKKLISSGGNNGN